MERSKIRKIKTAKTVRNLVKVYAFDRDGTLVWGDPAGPITKKHLLRMRELGHKIGGSGGQFPEEQYRNWCANGIEPDFAVHKKDLGVLKDKYKFVTHVGDAEDDKFYAAHFGIGYMAPQEFVAWLKKESG